MSQERYFKKLFFAQLNVELAPSMVDLSLPDICDAVVMIMDYSMSWYAALIWI